MSLSLDVLDRLIGFNTVSARSNLALMDYVTDFLKGRGFRLHPLPDADEDKAGLYAEIGPEVDGGVVLSAHSDVVPVEGQSWTRDPFKLSREGDLLFGRGTTDMKGFLAEMLVAADAASKMDLKEPLKLVISYDEETGCHGIARMQDRLAPMLGKPRLAIVGEPTEMQVAIGHKGKRSYRGHVTGEAGHSALAPQFVSALQVGVDFVVALRGMQDDLIASGAREDGYDIPYTTVHVGKLTSGRALNIVPDKADLLFEFRHMAGDDPEQLEMRFRQAARDVTAPHEGRAAIDIERYAAYPGLVIAPSHDVVRQVQDWSGKDTTKVAFGTEAGFFADMGVPTVVCGPGSMAGQGHKADEFVAEGQLVACGAMLGKAVGALV